jgi:chemotaxis protein histidine kinase CheA
MNCFVLPTELTLESISGCFVQILKILQPLIEKQVPQGEDRRDKIHTETSTSRKLEKPSLAVELYTVDGLLRTINQKVMNSLQSLEDRVNILIQTNEKLLIDIGKATRLFKTRSDILESKYSHLSNYCKTRFFQDLLKRKKKILFKTWKKETQNQKKVAKMLKKSLIQIHKKKLRTCLDRWKKLVRKIQEFQVQADLLRSERSIFQRLTIDIQGQFESIKSK